MLQDNIILVNFQHLRSYKMYKQTMNPFTNEPFTTQIRRIADNATIPFAPDNTDYQAYLKWLEEGNTPEPAEE